MNNRLAFSISAIGLLVAVALPLQLAAQQHHHYKLIELAPFGGPNSEDAIPLTADGINDKGEIAGGADFSAAGGSGFDAYLWKNGKAFDLGAVNGDCFSRALAINNKTQIVGNSFFCNSSFDNEFDRGFLWENGSIVDLNTLIPSDSSLILVATNDINDRAKSQARDCPQRAPIGQCAVTLSCSSPATRITPMSRVVTTARLRGAQLPLVQHQLRRLLLCDSR